MIGSKSLRKIVFFTVIILPCWLLTSNVSYAANALMGVKQFTLSSSDAIAREVVTGKVMAQIPTDFNGEIKLIWTNARFATIAQILRNELIEKGVAPYRIKLIHDVGGYREHGSDGVQIIVQQLALRQPECIDKGQNYRFDIHTDLGCTLTNTRDRSLVNPYQYDF